MSNKYVRWNFELLPDAIVVCRDEHSKAEGCQYEAMSLQETYNLITTLCSELNAAELSIQAANTKLVSNVTSPCSVCGGEGKPVSGGMCICRGSGTMVAELEGMRGLLFEITKEKTEYANTISKIKGVIAMAEEWAETQAMPETSACMSALKDIRRMVNTHSEEGIELQEGIQ